jgi:hypothetical protein
VTQPPLDALLGHLPDHARILRRLIEAVERDPAWRWLELGCSVARGGGDALSDLDLGLGVDDAAWPAALAGLPDLLAGLGEVVDMLQHRIAEWGDAPHRRMFVQYADGVQIDLVATPASRRQGLPRGNIALYDPDRRLAAPVTPTILGATPEDIREWAFLGWIALADLDKYLRRGSLWEALERLHEARRQVWRLWAAAHAVEYPVFGLTAVLDAPAIGIPPGIEETVAALDAPDLRRAAQACARLLRQTSSVASEQRRATLPDALAPFVETQVELSTE